jgi:osmotically-inducible protein OsmY
MSKIYYITESQYKILVERKKNEKILIDKISEELKGQKKVFNESKNNSSTIDIIKKYNNKGVLTENIIRELIKSNNINQKDLEKANINII